MPPRRRPTPSYLEHKASGRARAVWTDHLGRRHDRLLPGPYGSPESKTAYGRLLLELEVGPQPAGVAPRDGITIAEVLVAWLRFAQGHYRDPDGRQTSKWASCKLVARKLRELYGDTPAVAFGPLALKAVRQGWVADGLARSEVNARTGMAKRVFKWAASEELIPATVHHALQTVAGLQRGRTAARETEPVKPVADADVEATLPHLNRHVRGLVEFQRLTGCRPGEACRVRRCDIDTSGPVWVYSPTRHKTAYRGKARPIAVGPKAQAVLNRFAAVDPAAYVFSPRAAAAEHLAARTAKRKTPRWPSHATRNAAKRKALPKRTPAEKYGRHSYNQAVARACRRAGVPEWTPNQLRHTYATEVRKRFGLEAAQVLLGHERADVTQVYAEKNAALAAAVASEIG